MKKFALILAVLMIACFAAVGCKVKDDKSDDVNVTSTNAPASSEKAPESKESDPTSQSQPDSQSQSSSQSQPASQSQPSSQGGGQNPPAATSFEINFTANGGEGDANFTLVGTEVKSTGGKTAKDGWLNGTVFSGSFPQLGKGTTTYGNKNVQFTTTGACNVYVYATRGSSGVDEGNLYLIDTSTTIISTVHPVEALACYTLACTGAGSYALATDQVSSINIFAIKVDGSSGGASGGSSAVNPPASQQNPSSQGGGDGPSQTGSFEINFTANGGEGNANFTLVGAEVKSTGGKTAKDGWLNGTVFSGSFPQLGKGTTTYGNKNVQFTTTGACNVYVYATRGSSGVDEGNLYLIDTSTTIISTVHPVEALACYTLACPGAGSYALATDQVSSINIFAIKVG